MKPLTLAFTILSLTAGVGFASSSPYQDLVVQSGPVGYWRLGEAPGSIPLATNLGSTAPNNNGTYSGVLAAQPGALAGDPDTAIAAVAARFTAIIVPYSADLNVNGPFTVEVWVKPTNTVAAGSFTSPMASLRRSGTAAEGWIIYQANNGWNFRVGNSLNNYTGNITGGTVALNVWQHLVGVYDGSGISLYVNGQLVTNVAVNSFAPNPSVPLGIGARGDNSFFFNGGVDEAALYATALSAERIQAHYNNGMNAARAIAYPQEVLSDNPIAYYRLDEAAAPAANLGSLGGAGNGIPYNLPTLGQPGALLDDLDTAAGFNGVNQKIDVPYAASLNNPTAFSFECWAKVMGGAGAHRSPITSRDDTPAPNPHGYIIYAMPNNTWAFWSGTGSGWHTLAGPAIVEGEWAHLVGTYDGQYKSFYVNGVLVDSAATTIIPNNQRSLRIGGGATEGAGSFFFNGDVDEVAVYDKVITPQDVFNHFFTGTQTEPAAVAPTILTQPTGVNQWEGATITLSVRLKGGSTPFTFQWHRTSAGPIPGATNATLVWTNAQAADSDDYWLAISNGAGEVTSATATVTIQPIAVPTITEEPQSTTVYEGGRPVFRVIATGAPVFTYQWSFKGTAIPGATNGTLKIDNATANNAGDYQVVVTDSAGSVTSATATLTVATPEANTYPAFVMADRPVAYWRLNEAEGEVTASDYSGGHNGTYMSVTLNQPGVITGDPDTSALFDGASSKVEVPYSADLNPKIFSVELWAKVMGGAGSYRSPLTSRDDTPPGNAHGFIIYATSGNTWQLWTGTGNSAAPWATIGNRPVVNDEWVYLAATYDGTNQSLYVNGQLAASGAAKPVLNDARILRIGAGQTENATGTFFFNGQIDDVAVYDAVLPANRIALHYAASFGATTPPSITTQPLSQFVLPGGTLTLRAEAVGSLPMKFQWLKDGVAMPSATNLTLVLSNVQPTQAGIYQLIASNVVSLAASDEATVTVVAVPNVLYGAAVLEDVPAGYWRLGEANPAEPAVDEMGVNNGTYMNGVTLGVPGAMATDPNTAAAFTAANQTKVEVPYTPDLNPEQFTVECWAKVTGAVGNYRSPITSRDDYPQKGYVFYAAANNNWEFWSGTGVQVGWSIITGPGVVLDQWVHLVGTYDGTEKRFYVNGALVGSQTVVIVPNGARVLRIGAGATDSDPGFFFFEGAVDEVAVYPTALSQERILVHYAIGTKVRPKLAISQAGDRVTISWTAGKLLSADSVQGPYTEVANATSPYTLTKPPGTKFFRAAE